MDLHTLALDTGFLSVFRSLGEEPLVQHYRAVLEALETSPAAFASAYGALCEAVYRVGDSGAALNSLIHCNSNPLTDAIDRPSEALLHAATHDVHTLAALAALDGQTLLEAAAAAFGPQMPDLRTLPGFPAGSPLPFSDGESLTAYYQEKGFGYFAGATFFTIDKNRLVPVAHPDPVRLTDLKGYARQKEQVRVNTKAFLAGHAANNILLYGDKGTGKSSTVKAIVNEYAGRGLKIIELSVAQIPAFPMICRYAAHSPFKIIVFLDDLTFDREDDNFAMLKAFIEGGLTGKPDNLILYATSNRRHLIRETFADRQGDDVHRRDTLETITSLSDRFGLEITFSVPDRDEYLDIVDELAADCGLQIAPDELHMLAERFALRRNGRSPRTARQFIQMQIAEGVQESSK